MRSTEAGLEPEAARRHAELVVRELGLSEATPNPSPGEQASRKDEEQRVAVELGRDEARRYRATAARLNYLALDRTDILFCEQGMLKENVSTQEWRLGRSQASGPISDRQAAIGVTIRMAGTS